MVRKPHINISFEKLTKTALPISHVFEQRISQNLLRWQKTFDEDGTPYYYDQETQETRWDPPPGWQEEEEEEEEEEEAAQ